MALALRKIGFALPNLLSRQQRREKGQSVAKYAPETARLRAAQCAGTAKQARRSVGRRYVLSRTIAMFI
jgi:hypothetical protein